MKIALRVPMLAVMLFTGVLLAESFGEPAPIPIPPPQQSQTGTWGEPAPIPIPPPVAERV